VERARLVQMLLRRGISLEAIEKAEREGRLLGRNLELMFPEGPSETYSLAEVAEMVGLDLEFVRKFWIAAGLGDQGELAREEDVEAFRTMKTLRDIGLPEEALLEGARVYTDALTRVAEMESRTFHFYVHERLKAEGVTGDALLAATTTAGDRAAPLIEPSLLYFHRKGWERAIREDTALHMAEEAGLVEKGKSPGEMTSAVAFVDLSSFTPLAEAMGDLKAAEVLERFSALVRESAARWEGRVVKQIGDAFMLVFPDARSAVACALEIETRTAEEPQFPAARSGIHRGQVLYREGDYVGSNVNIASRVAAEAQRHQVLVTDAVRKEAKTLPGVEFVPLGERRLKGLASELVLFEARPAGAAGREKHVDPVCGMEMTPDEVAARLTLDGVEHCFCSDDCLRKYVAAPERYAT